MAHLAFNLRRDPWIQVLTKATGTVQTVSLATLLDRPQDYDRLAGDTAAQDLAVLRLLLALLHTVYSRVDATGQPYDWLDLDPTTGAVNDIDPDASGWAADLLATWQTLHQTGQFGAALDYLTQHEAQFDFFGATPFYQVTAAQYDALVPAKKQIHTGTGTVALKQINRLVSESANSPALFAPKSGAGKDSLTLPELVRWVITYQNFTGVTDKSKIETPEKFAAPAGWLYRLNPVFAKGQDLVETLLLNLVLTDGKVYHSEQPVWEQPLDAYVAQRIKQVLPDNVAALYTAWSRLLHIEWDTAGRPTIFAAGLPMYASDNAFIEPMTTWRRDDKAAVETYRPATRGQRNMAYAMWRNFGQYVRTSSAVAMHEPGVVQWLGRLQEQQLLARERHLTLAAVALISDGNATSQSPVAEMVDDMTLAAAVLFDRTDGDFWPGRIEDTIAATQQIGRDYWAFLSNVATIRNLDRTAFGTKHSAAFYARLNGPFKDWLASLTNQDDREARIREWYQTLQRLVLTTADAFVQQATPRDLSGIETERGVMNIFVARNILAATVRRDLNIEKRNANG
ncbi:type I-E CRISPR-associated protein Cse1/CasA [Lacticaseibacillus parakribbianus]|uniref:type I-E CRISPR-associated protein Cse1/CasA n=1 Tax=Lacticaseibacillus parakribbianus TaxID=2970927 RepID=UPI0021CAEFAA|nr:type I-E CRISPR-associated protein Cse1/CasA [Lacticaseibacillus parakribbianus]